MVQARKKLMACIFALTIVIIFMSILTPQADAIEGNAYTWSGSGTAEDPYLISTPDQLQEIATENEGAAGFPNIYFKQTADLVFDGAENNYTPIGSYSCPFNGIFNGDGHMISGININNTAADYQALFGYLGIQGYVMGVHFADSSINGNSYVAGIVGSSDGTVLNYSNNSQINGASYVGGIVGHNGGRYRGVIAGCTNGGDVTGSGYRIGGIAGDIQAVNTTPGPQAMSISSYMWMSSNTGNISGGSYVGGIVGFNYGSTITGAYNTGGITGGNPCGGIAGYLYKSGDPNLYPEVRCCYNSGNINGNGADVVIGVNSVMGPNDTPMPTYNIYYLLAEGSTSNNFGKTASEMKSDAFGYMLNNKLPISHFDYNLPNNNDPQILSVAWSRNPGLNDGYPIFTDANNKAIYKVTLNDNGSTTEVYSNYSGITPSLVDPIREGYRFCGWYTGENGTGTAFNQQTSVTADITVYANWQESIDECFYSYGCFWFQVHMAGRSFEKFPGPIFNDQPMGKGFRQVLLP